MPVSQSQMKFIWKFAFIWTAIVMVGLYFILGDPNLYIAAIGGGLVVVYFIVL